MKFRSALVILLFLCIPVFARDLYSFNQGWRFHRIDDSHSSSLDEPALDDGDWEKVAIPHSVRLEPINASGGRNFQGICWYRRHFTLRDDWKNKILYLRFEGAMQVADLWLNGQKLTTHFGGYLPFTVDITPAVHFGADNVLSVRLDNRDNKDVPPGKPQDQLDFVYFGGLYREVNLIVHDPLHISGEILADKPAGGGIFVSYPLVTHDQALVNIQADVLNESLDKRAATMRNELIDAAGNIVASASLDASIDPARCINMLSQIKVQSPKLWHPDHPNLYTLRTTLLGDGKPCDAVSTRIGIRSIRFERDTGFWINDERYVSVGANRHQDHPYVGYAIPPSGQWRDVKRLREAGFTSFRSHYPPDPSFFDACDELGMLVIVSNPGWQFAPNTPIFNQRVYQDAREMVRRNRNRPSVILWEAQLNESPNREIFPTLQKIIHEEYPFPPCYTAGDGMGRAGAANWDVVYEHATGDHPFWKREWGDSVDNWHDQQSRSRVARSYGEAALLVQAWAHARMFNDLLDPNILAGGRPRGVPLCGVDIWAGIDAYRGYHHQPFLGGPLDLFRLPKFDDYLFQSQRDPNIHVAGLNDGPMVFIASYVTPQSPGSVTVFSNCEQVRLSLSGREIGTQSPLKDMHGLRHPPFVFQVGPTEAEQSTMFMTAATMPSVKTVELTAEGLIGGKVAATQTVRAPGVPSQILLTADLDGHDMTADGADWVRVYARICDAHGTTHPYAEDAVTFTVEGAGTLITDARIANNPVAAEAGIATALVRAGNTPGKITVRAAAFGLKGGEVTIETKAMNRPIAPGADAGG